MRNVHQAEVRIGNARDAALPFMEDVNAVVGNHVQLGVLEGDDVLFVERLSARTIEGWYYAYRRGGFAACDEG